LTARVPTKNIAVGPSTAGFDVAISTHTALQSQMWNIVLLCRVFTAAPPRLDTRPAK